MEQEAVMKEHASLESQLGALRAQISCLNLELEEQKAKVNLVSDLVNFSVFGVRVIATCLSCRLLPRAIIMIRFNLSSMQSV